MMPRDAGKTPRPVPPDRFERSYRGDTEFVGEAGMLIASGVMDLFSAPGFRQDLDNVMSSASGDIILDLCDVDLIDSTTLGIMLLARRRLEDEGRWLVLVVTEGQVRRILAIAGLLTAFPLVATRREALQQVVARVDPACVA